MSDRKIIPKNERVSDKDMKKIKRTVRGYGEKVAICRRKKLNQIVKEIIENDR